MAVAQVDWIAQAALFAAFVAATTLTAPVR
jgi:hypothetical protein